MKKIKIAIHHIKNSFSDRWIEYCEQNGISFKLVDCTQSDIIEQLNDCDGLMWHWQHTDYKSKLYALQLTLSLEKIGKKVFPNSNSCWHFDDKVGQKYLFESIGAPLVDSYIFYTKKEAVEWVNNTTFPKVFKLRGGASSTNVLLIKNKKQAKSKINIAFNKGFPAFSSLKESKEKLRILFMKKDYHSFMKYIKSLVRLIIPNKDLHLLPREKGYVYFQEFISGNKFDTRVLVIGDKCFSTVRYVRKNDFRASGSGNSDHSPSLVNKDYLKIAFDLAEKLDTQSLSIDFINDKEQIKITEISYAFPMSWYDKSQGYWDKKLKWHEGFFKSQYWMIENLIDEILKSKLN